MTSDKQKQANRRNALKSTGPKTPEGKAAVRHNALKHGLLAQQALLPNEDEAAFEELGERLREELRPVGELEGRLVDRIIAAHWRLHRLGRVEAGMFAMGQRRREAAEESLRRADRFAERLYFGYMELPPPEAAEHPQEEEHPEDLSEAECAKAKDDDETVELGRTFVLDAEKANAFSKLSRYEAGIERGLYRALHELHACRPPAGPRTA